MSIRGTTIALGLALTAGVMLPFPAPQAGENADSKLLIHLVPVSSRRGLNCFMNLPKAAPGAVTAGKLRPQHYIAYVLVTDFSLREGISGVQFGVTYDDSLKSGVDIASWQSCALYEWPMDGWPAGETGNLLTWNQAEDCQEKFPVPVGFFYLTAYSADRLKIIPRPVDGLARVAACGITPLNQGNFVENVAPENLGWADFGGGKGYNPWDPTQNLKTMSKRFQPIKNE